MSAARSVPIFGCFGAKPAIEERILLLNIELASRAKLLVLDAGRSPQDLAKAESEHRRHSLRERTPKEGAYRI
jgi:hypothetical protein